MRFKLRVVQQLSEIADKPLIRHSSVGDTAAVISTETNPDDLSFQMHHSSLSFSLHRSDRPTRQNRAGDTFAKYNNVSVILDQREKRWCECRHKPFSWNFLEHHIALYLDFFEEKSCCPGSEEMMMLEWTGALAISGGSGLPAACKWIQIHPTHCPPCVLLYTVLYIKVPEYLLPQSTWVLEYLVNR